MNKKIKQALSNLLAVMHGDGGHHEGKVGTLQAIKDAEALLHNKWVIRNSSKEVITFTPNPCTSHKQIDLGYMQWHEWASQQENKGIVQSQCTKCGHWLYPQEM